MFTFTSTDLVADALKVGNMVTGDTSGEHTSLTCPESDGSEVADALNDWQDSNWDSSEVHASLTSAESDG